MGTGENAGIEFMGISNVVSDLLVSERSFMFGSLSAHLFKSKWNPGRATTLGCEFGQGDQREILAVS